MLRALIFGQITWIAFLGLFARVLLPLDLPLVSLVVSPLVTLLFMPLWIGFPIATYIALSRTDLSSNRQGVVLLLLPLLGFLYFVALLPAFS